ncbi:tRNA N(3)-methylcytidine methyltransferase METTL2-like isoform X2 [Mangifera indica]|uniref:tRNA N(3)-methylcytidine methyltransferase METTL2-like isoform X2 n=1 Tax=Mangifera indica TaxID=29780 RepID=UPI001CF9D9CA|nr:tRNA N(3)-methylcytidine methyltransferase METTL2-like isoform X2 [Mangifera indica]
MILFLRSSASRNPLARCYFYTQKPRRWKRLEKMRGVSSLGFSHSFSFITTVRLLHRRSHPTVVHSQLRECQSLEEQYQKKAKKYWDSFYKRHQNKFFKDRHYLQKDWGHYFSDDSKFVLEVGCGAGNTIFPLVAAYPKLYVHACDMSPQAIELVKIFMLSAVSPKKMPLILENIKSVLKPNGFVLVRDYAVGDFAQVKLQGRNQMIGDNFYVRGDGTCSFYFSEDFLSTLFLEAGFNTIDVSVYCKQIKNNSRGITMDRRWIRAVFNNFNSNSPDSALIRQAR